MHTATIVLSGRTSICHAGANLLLVADPVGRLQALLQKGEAQFVDGRFVEIVLHKAVKKHKETL